MLASSRKVVIADNIDQEEAWNYGLSIATYIPLFGKTLNLNAEYYYTDFQNQLVIDMESDAHKISFGNLDGRSYIRSRSEILTDAHTHRFSRLRLHIRSSKVSTLLPHGV